MLFEFKLTDEQERIINKLDGLNNHLAINAYAGAGKTTTLELMAKAYPDKKFLYLAYNANIREEASKRFPDNVDVYTTHGLAYKWYKTVYNRKPYVGNNSTRLYYIADRFNIPFEVAYVVRSALHFYCNSNYTLDQVISRYKEIYKDKLKINIKDFSDKFKNAVITLVKDMQQGKIEMPHDFYLKMASLKGIYEVVDEYDYILLDEAQDTNPVVYEMLITTNKPIIAVGDMHQKIYGFRNAIDIINLLHKDYNAEILYLTSSFRFGKRIANVAYDVLTKVKGAKGIPKIKGLGPKFTTEETYAIITRTNAGIINAMDELDANGDRYFTYKSPSEIFKVVFALYQVFDNEPSPFKLDNQLLNFIRSFNSKHTLQSFATAAQDYEILKAIEVYEKFPYKRIKELYDTLKRFNKSRKGFCILTAHTSKGLEFNEVRLYNDWNRRLFTGSSLIEESNLLYVAITRALEKVTLNSTAQELLQHQNKHIEEVTLFSM